LRTQVIKVDEAALHDLGFTKDALAEGADMRVWSDQAGKAELDSMITKLKEKDQLTVVAAPSTLAQNGKPSSVAVFTEEYYMLAESEEESTEGIKLNLTPRVEENQRITLDVDLGAMPQTRTSTASQSGVRSNRVSLSAGDSVILVKPDTASSGPGQSPRREAVIVTATLLPPAQPEAHAAKTRDEFTLPPASRFKQMPVNPWVLSEQDALSTFALDVDTASYAMCRQYIEHGFLPPQGAVRMEEFVNAFDYAYPQRSEPTFSVMAEGASSPFAEPGQALSLVKIAVKARTVGRDQRKAAHLVFVVDSSASMGQADRLPLIQQGLSRLVEELGPQDRVSLVSCSDQARLLLDRVPARDRDMVIQAVHAIQPSGSTNLLAGLQLGYGTAKTHYAAGQINQVILCSDGVANVGATEAESVLEAVAADREQGIMLMCVGVGYGAYNDVLLEALANQGDGRYVFVDGADQVDRVFVQPLASALQTVAKDARIQVKFNPDVVRRYRLVGYENRDIKDEQFRDDTVDAGEVGSGQCVTALYEIELTNSRSGQGDLGTVFVRYKDTDTQAFEEIARPLSGTLIRARTVAQSPRFYLAASAARFAEWLRQSEHAKATGLDQIQSIVDEISAALPLDQDIRELANLIRQAEGLPRAP
jgi:Ca-activated chloride channel family protein